MHQHASTSARSAHQVIPLAVHAIVVGTVGEVSMIRLRTRRRRLSRAGVLAALAGIVMVPLAPAVAATAATGTTAQHSPPQVSPGPAVPGVHAAASHFAKPPAQPPAFTPSRTVWPAARSATVAL